MPTCFARTGGRDFDFMATRRAPPPRSAATAQTLRQSSDSPPAFTLNFDGAVMAASRKRCVCVFFFSSFFARATVGGARKGLNTEVAARSSPKLA